MRLLPGNHPVEALETIPERSAGGRVRDELFGDGFARWARESDEKLPDLIELLHSNYTSGCNPHLFVHDPADPAHRIFKRPQWPTVSDELRFERRREDWSSLHPGEKFQPVQLERDF